LSTVRLSELIEKDLGISIPLHILFGPNITFQNLTDLIHDPSQLRFFFSSTLSQLIDEYRWDPPSITLKQRRISAIFITGTTGFMGALILADDEMFLLVVFDKQESLIRSGTMMINIVSLLFVVSVRNLGSDYIQPDFNRWLMRRM
jgi:hypothetical protein